MVDVQQAMLDDTMRRGRDRGVENITPTCAGAQHLPYPDGAASLGEAAAFDDGAAIPLGADVSRSASRLPLGECGGAVLDRRLAAREHDRVRPHALLLDIDGVLYVEDEPVGGAVAAVARLRAAGCALRFVTNTTNRTRAATLAKLLRLGFAVADSELITPAALAVRVCRERGHRRVALFVAEGVEVDFAGLEQVDGAHADGAHADAVIVGDLGEAWDYAALNAAFRLAMDGAELIALQKNRYWQRADGLSLDVGPFVAALEYATGREATVVGKPAAAFFEQALADAGAAAGDTVMVGDDVESDVGGALRAGLAGILVRTGKYREEIVRASGIEPTATVDSIADVPALVGA
jgi:HAD superfamily hydrolase (TIGR01458 family)